MYPKQELLTNVHFHIILVINSRVFKKTFFCTLFLFVCVFLIDSTQRAESSLEKSANTLIKV